MILLKYNLTILISKAFCEAQEKLMNPAKISNFLTKKKKRHY